MTRRTHGHDASVVAIKVFEIINPLLKTCTLDFSGITAINKRKKKEIMAYLQIKLI